MSLVLGGEGARLIISATGGRARPAQARLEVPGLEADCALWLDPSTPEPPLSEFFAEIAESWRGWPGVKRWDSYEGVLALSLVHDGLGHIRMTVQLSDATTPDGWTARGTVTLDAGALSGYAQAARRLGETMASRRPDVS